MCHHPPRPVPSSKLPEESKKTGGLAFKAQNPCIMDLEELKLILGMQNHNILN